MHPFRERGLQCPRCGKPLANYPERDKWRCRSCNGVLVGGEQLIVEIGPHASAVIDGDADPARPAIHPCPGCAYPMTPYTIAGVAAGPGAGVAAGPGAGKPAIEIDRCVADRVVWFDGGEIGKIRAQIPAEDESLFTNAAGFLGTLQTETTALHESPDAIPLVDWPMAPMTSGQWKARTLCTNGACNGVIVDGRCTECGTLASATGST